MENRTIKIKCPKCKKYHWAVADTEIEAIAKWPVCMICKLDNDDQYDNNEPDLISTTPYRDIALTQKPCQYCGTYCCGDCRAYRTFFFGRGEGRRAK